MPLHPARSALRRWLQASALSLLASTSLISPLSQAAKTLPAQLRIGYQKGTVNLVLAKSYALVEQAYPQLRVNWVEFPAGPQLLEALNAGSIDLGATGDMPPIFAQAAGVDLLYVGYEPPQPRNAAIIVGKDSRFQRTEDLRGAKVAVQKGSSAHNLLLRALASAGLSITDIQPVYLAPADARSALASGAVDGWVIWDPFYAAALLHGNARTLRDGSGITDTGSFYLAAGPFVHDHPDFVKGVLAALNQSDSYLRQQPQHSVKILAASMGLPEDVIERLVSNRDPSGVFPLNDTIVAAQQQSADRFYQQKLIPRDPRVSEVIWQAPQEANQ
ncbi:aliphatic sulfonate ABC transporter substrate-binding protein [Pokkaliibacter sp. MBI-7]|uniref:aliphatic sulfonate ABC transporter substrate-binding protein n=1 Tax=Pokkaliibacter sp. MBI-7 TaxID=3040600 RepID=UPI0024484777|nr:aliphatic sulfonate ABC transporter substrate-binding protein [Pokkaliibacter sp. MBI-7]MDH2432745.1 aliphatic sulfonate ABC transporter substrate-binding protein [Pokkaliibacter sp. MBI-7]